MWWMGIVIVLIGVVILIASVQTIDQFGSWRKW